MVYLDLMQSETPRTKNKNYQSSENKKDLPSVLIKFGIILVTISVLLFAFIFYPAISNEIRFFLNKNKYKYQEIELNRNAEITNVINENGDENVLVPVNSEFSILVPKINANAAVIENVDPYRSSIYQQALTKGVAHAAGSAVPGRQGNTFIFAHSSDNFYNANRYNSVFYLLNKMELKDTFYIIKDKKAYEYEVFDTKIVEPDEVNYLTDSAYDQQATLMTCWPPGTTLQRLLVMGKLKNIEHAPRD